MNCGCEHQYIGPSLERTCGGGTFILFMSLLDTFLRRQCDLTEICGRIRPIIVPDPIYDFIVIGGGSGGATVAGRLSNNPDWKILLIEAGGDEPPGSQIPSMVINFQDSEIDWKYKTDPEDNACLGYPERRCNWPRGKVLGGSSVLNGMMYMRGTPYDYDQWASWGNGGWSYQDVLPVFKRLEDNWEVGSLVDGQYHGTGGPMTTVRFRDQPEPADYLLQAAAELGYPVTNDLNGKDYSGFTIAQSNTLYGARQSSARAFLRPARARPNLHIMLNSTATKILIDTTTDRKIASGIEFVYNNKLYHVKTKYEVILAAGALNSPQLLLLSGVGPKDELDKVAIKQIHHLPGVGKNLHNHVTFYLSYLMRKVNDFTDLNWAEVLNYFTNKDGPMTSTGLSQVTARINSKFANPSGISPDLQIFFAGYLANCAENGEVQPIEKSENITKPKHITISPVALHPKSRGTVTLKSNNPLDYPSMKPNYLQNPYDVAVLIDGIRIIQRLTNTTVLKERYGLELEKEQYGDCGDRYEYDTDQFWECAIRYYTGPEHHQAGTCKMGPQSDPFAVVNPKLQVYGIDGLRVADASIMPQLVSGNTHATIVMIGERAVQFIREKYLTKKFNPDNFYIIHTGVINPNLALKDQKTLYRNYVFRYNG